MRKSRLSPASSKHVPYQPTATSPWHFLSSLGASRLQCGCDKVNLLVGTSTISQVWCQDGEGARADGISWIADDVGFGLRKVWNLTIILSQIG